MKGNNNPTRLPAAGACTRMNRYPSPEGAGLPAHSGILERYGRIGLETEEPAFAFEAIGHAPELADAGRVKRKSLPPSEYLWVCLRASNYGYEAGKRHGVFPGFAGCFDTSQDKKIQQYSLVTREGITLLHSMDLPSDIPLQELDATGQTWTTGNPVDTKK